MSVVDWRTRESDEILEYVLGIYQNTKKTKG